VNSILAIEKSDEFDDWRELIRLYMVRRTRSFILQHYTEADKHGRRYIAGKDGEKRYFPVRKPISLTFKVDETDPADRYATALFPRCGGSDQRCMCPATAWACTSTRRKKSKPHRPSAN
jgi:hypothetical protein